MSDDEREQLFARVVNKLDLLEQIRLDVAITADGQKRLTVDNEQHRLQLQAFSTQLQGVDKKVDALCVGCAERHKRISEEMDNAKELRAALTARIESTRQWIGKVQDGKKREDMTGPVALPPTAVDVVKLLDDREAARVKRDQETEDARSKRQRQWLAVGIPVVLALLGAPQVRQCVGEERAARVEQAVQRLEAKPAQKVIVTPMPQPVLVGKPDAEVP